MIIRQALEDEVKDVVKFIDTHFTKEGYGFVTSAQIRTETKRGSVFIAIEDEIIGVRIGLNKIYNLAVHPNYRRLGIGRQLVEAYPAGIIRVKAEPVGHLSKAQLDGFRTPVEFYEKIGYEFDYFDYPKNFWQRGKGKESHFHKQGKRKHIRVYKKKEEPMDMSEYIGFYDTDGNDITEEYTGGELCHQLEMEQGQKDRGHVQVED